MLVLCKILKGSKQLPFAAKLRHVFIFSVLSILDIGGISEFSQLINEPVLTLSFLYVAGS